MSDDKYYALTEEPVFFERNRVFRITLGGKLFHDFFGDDPVDTHYPEEWIASDVNATLNSRTDQNEGISRIRGTNIYFHELLQAESERMTGGPKKLGILVKLLDSSMRLPVQVHPDKTFSGKHLNSDFGKVESWLILATRGNAKIYFGFKNKTDDKILSSAIQRNETDKNALEEMMYSIPVKPGDVFLIPAGSVHAIGAGILLAEFQEPTDFTITPEVWCGGTRIDENLKYLGLDREIALGCIDYSIYGEHAEKIGRKTPVKYADTDQYTSETLISADDTPCFRVNRHRIRGSFKLPHNPAVIVVTGGSGSLITKKASGISEKPLQKGDYFFLPFVLSGLCSVTAAAESLEIIECLPPP